VVGEVLAVVAMELVNPEPLQKPWLDTLEKTGATPRSVMLMIALLQTGSTVAKIAISLGRSRALTASDLLPEWDG
jgi:hypothetical protein